MSAVNAEWTSWPQCCCAGRRRVAPEHICSVEILTRTRCPAAHYRHRNASSAVLRQRSSTRTQKWARAWATQCLLTISLHKPSTDSCTHDCSGSPLLLCTHRSGSTYRDPLQAAYDPGAACLPVGYCSHVMTRHTLWRRSSLHGIGYQRRRCVGACTC